MGVGHTTGQTNRLKYDEKYQYEFEVSVDNINGWPQVGGSNYWPSGNDFVIVHQLFAFSGRPPLLGIHLRDNGNGNAYWTALRHWGDGSTDDREWHPLSGNVSFGQTYKFYVTFKPATSGGYISVSCYKNGVYQGHFTKTTTQTVYTYDAEGNSITPTSAPLKFAPIPQFGLYLGSTYWGKLTSASGKTITATYDHLEFEIED